MLSRAFRESANPFRFPTDSSLIRGSRHLSLRLDRNFSVGVTKRLNVLGKQSDGIAYSLSSSGSQNLKVNHPGRAYNPFLNIITTQLYSTLATLPQISTHSRHTTIYWNPEDASSTQSNYHYIWLRDHCRCPKCFHEVTKQRLVNTFSIPHGLRPSRIAADSEGLKVFCEQLSPICPLYHSSKIREFVRAANRR